jgi:NRPS condensation-like uncharacterized protein
MQTADLNHLDELYLHLDRPDEPWGVHFEVALGERLDADRLRDAIRAAAAQHPIARARLADWRAVDTSYRWEIADELADVPLVVADDATAARMSLYAASPSLDAAPPFEMVLARDGDGDALMLNLHHAAGDGLSAARLMASVLRAYDGEPDPLPGVDPLVVRDIRSLASGSPAERLTRATRLIEHLVRSALPPARVAPDGGDERPGYGFELLELGPDESRAVVERRRDGATVNDVLLAALAVAVRRWNERHDESTGRIALMMPVNLRPPEWRFEVMANFASYVTVPLGEDDHRELEAAVAATAERTRRIKDDGLAALIVDLLQLPSLWPAVVKRRLQDLIPLTGNRVVDTAVLSNLGRLEPPARDVRAVWFSPPGRMPLGASFGVASLHDRLFVTLRYRHALFGPEAAAAFAAVYRDVLVSG